MDCKVVVETAVPVYDVEIVDEAIRIAISKTGGMLNPDLKYVETSVGACTSFGDEEFPPAFIAADEAPVALKLEMTVFNVKQEEHASRVARKEIGQRLENIPLKMLSVDRVDHESVETDDEGGTRTETGVSDPDETLVDFDDLVDGR